MVKKFFLLALWGILYVSCSQEESTHRPVDMPIPIDIGFKNCKIDTIDEENHQIIISSGMNNLDSLVIGSSFDFESGIAYLAADADLVDPELGELVKPGMTISLKDTSKISIVVLSADGSIDAVWLICKENCDDKVVESSCSAKSSSSSKTAESSSSLEKVKSSSSSETPASSSGKSSSSSKTAESSSSLEKVKSSSSSETPASSSGKSCSSSKTAESSSSLEKVKSSSSSEAPASSSGKSSSSSKTAESSSSLEKVKSSSSLETPKYSCSSEVPTSSATEPPEPTEPSEPVSSSSLSSEKAVLNIDIMVNGNSLSTSNIQIQQSSRTIIISIKNQEELSFIQINSISLSEGASSNVELSIPLTFTPINNISAEYSFNVSAEDLSSTTWTLKVIYPEPPKNIKVSEIVANSNCNGKTCSITVLDDVIYVETQYNDNLSSMILSPIDTANDFRNWKSLMLENEIGELKEYRIKAGYQVPGSNFDERVDPFWGTSNDAQVASAISDGCAVFFPVTVSSENSLSVNGSSISLITQEVAAKSVGFEGGWKVASGYYFAGSYSGSNALEMYEEGRTSGCPLEDAVSNLTRFMSFGRPFTARPESFELTYSYAHVANKSSDYPQKSLIYVMLVSSKNKVVASGVISDESSVESSVRQVPLVYGSDSGLLSGGYAVAEGLSVGTGDEDVAYIHIMFASSAYAHNVAGGIAGKSNKYRGGTGSTLTIENFKLVY